MVIIIENPVVKYISFFLIVIFFSQCVTDKSKVVEADLDNSAIETEVFEAPKIKTLEVAKKTPAREDWQLVQELTLEDFTPSGIAYHDGEVFLSDTSQSIVIRAGLETNIRDTIGQNIKVVYVNQRSARIVLPIIDRDSIFVYRGSKNLYKMQITESLNQPSYFDGFRKDEYFIVDKGNHRIVKSQRGEVSIIGSKGTKPGAFLSPTFIHIAFNKLFVSDTGNKRLQMFSIEGEYEATFGIDEKVESPTALSSDKSNLFVLDDATKKVSLYSSQGKYIYDLPLTVKEPTDLFFHRDKLYVTDRVGTTVKVYSNAFYN